MISEIDVSEALVQVDKQVDDFAAVVSLRMVDPERCRGPFLLLKMPSSEGRVLAGEEIVSFDFEDITDDAWDNLLDFLSLRVFRWPTVSTGSVHATSNILMDTGSLVASKWATRI